MTDIIYKLVDPRDSLVRYVGKTNNLKRRLWQHYYDNKEAKTPKRKWIKELLELGLEPVLDICERVESAWQEREKFWIKYYKDLGHPLTNISDGGFGGNLVRVPRSKEWCENISKSNTGKKRSLESKKRISNALKGRVSPNKSKKYSDELRKKLSLAHLGKPSNKKGTHLSDEVKRKISRTLTGRKLSMETVSKMIGRKLSIETRNRMSKSAKDAWAKRKEQYHAC